ncbi:queuosine precursor transporter [Flavobacteriales bacterium]|nr:queuosine precursor transporter [Flavobacteriales bacterium]MDC3337901.1 queuosine precursor transporter [Flavobacteriales bacterium]
MFSFKGSESALNVRRESVFLVLAGIFLGSLTMLNILGITRFIDLSFTIGETEIPFKLAVGILAYPITFLCTDFISELYGRRRANLIVWIGLILNLWVLFILWLGGELPPYPEIDPATGLPPYETHGRVFFEIRELAFGATAASMIAYLTAQFCDVHIFHWLKRLTKGKHLWLRNNGSTLISQLVDSVAVVLITHYYAHALPIDENESLFTNLTIFVVSAYVFKFATALADTVPFYFGVKWLSNYLEIDPNEGYLDDEENQAEGTDEIN